jgi:hypothetical protein
MSVSNGVVTSIQRMGHINIVCNKGCHFQTSSQQGQRVVRQVFDGTKDQEVGGGGGGGLDVASKEKVEDIDDNRRRDDRDISVVHRGVYIILSRKRICRGHLGALEDLPDHVEVLEKQSPSGWSVRQLAGSLM